MKIFGTLLLFICLIGSFELTAQNCEFTIGFEGSYYNVANNNNNHEMFRFNNNYYVVNIKTPIGGLGKPSLISFRKLSNCGQFIAEKLDTFKSFNSYFRYKIAIVQGSPSTMNICLFGAQTDMYEMDTNCNIKKLFSINNQTNTFSQFIKSSANQFIFVGNQQNKAFTFALDTSGNKIWHTTCLDYSSYSQIQKGLDGNIYVVGSEKNNFTKSIIDTNGLMHNTLLYSVIPMLDSANYGVSLSNNGKNLYATILVGNEQFFYKYDDNGILQKSNVITNSKAKIVFNLKATSNGFAAFTDFENYLIDSNLKPFFNQIYFYEYSVGVSRSYGLYKNYQTLLSLETDSFIVSLGARTEGPWQGPQGAALLFSKTKITNEIYKPILVDSVSEYVSDLVGASDTFLFVSVKNIFPLYINWSCNKKNILFYSKRDAWYYDKNRCLLQYSAIRPDTVTLCARNYFRSQYSIDVCQPFIFKKYNTSVPNSKVLELIKIYPNPAKDVLNIEVPINSVFVFKMVDLLGRIILEQTIYTNTSINTEHLNSGLYNTVLTDASGNKIFNKVFIEQ
jgi:hypothetical protein